jgi:PAS domain S-box-containing protein
MKNTYNESNQAVKNDLISMNEVRKLLDALRESEEKYKQLQENVPIGLYQSTPEGKFTYVNKWAAKILGYSSPEELAKVNTRDLYADPRVRSKIVLTLTKNGFLDDTEVRLKCKNKSEIWAVINAKTVYNDSVAKTFDGYVYNITERKKALELLKDSEEMFRTISQNLKSALFIFNTKGQFEYINPAMCEITEYPQKELIGKEFHAIVHPDYVEIVKSRGFNRLMGIEVPKSYEFKILTKRGTVKWIEVLATRLLLKGQHVVMGLGKDISDQKNALEIIRNSEQKYKTLYSVFRLMADNVTDMIWAKDLRGRYIFANKAICDKLLMAKNVEEPIGKTDMFFAERERRKYPDNPEWHTFGEICGNTDLVVLKSKKSERFDEYGNVRGKLLFLDVIKAPFRDESGQVIGTVGSARDVTKEREIEQEHRRIEKLQSVIYSISAASGATRDLKELITVIRNELGQVIDTTNFFIALYDKDKDEINLPYFIDEKDHFTTFPKGKSLTGLVITQKKSMLLKEKNIRELEDSGLIDPIGTPSKVWMGVPLMVKESVIGAIVVQNYIDGTAFSKKDLDLLEYVSSQLGFAITQKQADDELRESEKRLRKIIDTVPHMIYAKDRSGTFILANKLTAESYGLPVEMVEGHQQSSLHIYKDEVSKFEKDDCLLFDKAESFISTEEKFTDSKGTEHILQTIKIPFKTSNTKEMGLLGVSIDITERKKFEIELKFAKEKAEESDRLKTAFLANMSHEIRTPMNAIIGFSELLNDSDITIETRKEFIRLISESSRMLLNLIEDIIDVAKIEAEQLKMVNGICHVNQIIDELERHYLNGLKKNSNSRITIRVKKGNPDPKLAIITDPLRFKQVMNNLIGNALKFTDEGEVEFGFEILNEKIIQFFIRDTGIGLPSDKLSVIFERFRQAEESTTKEYGGTGLGLTISRKLIELMGGKIWVESVHHVGSTFYFTLPFNEVKENEKLKPFEVISDKHDWSGKTILVAEDENSNFEVLKATLSRTNAKVLRANNGKEAVELCSKKKVDLVLMDIRMPEMNGYDATRVIKAKLPDLPIVSLTAYAMAEDREKSLAVGCNDHLSKPIKPHELISKISRFLK